MKCPEQLRCKNFHSKTGTTHVIRATEECQRYHDGTCPELGHACNIDKVEKMRQKDAKRI